MMGVEPTGKRVEVSGVEINHVEKYILPTPYPRSATLCSLPRLCGRGSRFMVTDTAPKGGYALTLFT